MPSWDLLRQGLGWVGQPHLPSLLLALACLDVCWAACQLTCQMDVTAPGCDPVPPWAQRWLWASRLVPGSPGDSQ